MNIKKGSIILNVILLISLIVIVIVFNEKGESVEKNVQRSYAKQSFGIMMYLHNEMYSIIEKYDNNTLSNQDMNNHYDNLDRFVLSVYNQQPFEFISNVRLFRFFEKVNATQFDNTKYQQYLDIYNILHQLYIENSSEKHEDPYAFLFEVYKSEEFHDQLENLLLKLQ